MRPLIAALAVVLAAAPAFANDTAMHMGAHGPEPVGGGFAGPESSIRMVAERLNIVFGKRATRVRARFTFRGTLEGVTATQIVGFPDEGAAQLEMQRRSGTSEGRDFMPPLQRVETRVDGQLVKSGLKYGYVRAAAGGPGWVAADARTGTLMAWHALTVSFPPDRDVVVERSYATANALNALDTRFFEYITHTGGPWKGPIGELVAEVRLVDGLKVDKLLWPGARLSRKAGGGTIPKEGATEPARRSWEVLAPDRMRLVWRDFEPRVDATRAGFRLVVAGS